MELTTTHDGSIFNFATEQAQVIGQLGWVDIFVCGVIGLMVVGLLTAVVIKFRARPGDPEPKQDHGDVRYETTWTIIPALVLLAMGVMTAIVMNKVNPPVGNRQPDIIVNAHQWWWEYRYPKTGVVTANELYMPVGATTLMEMQAADVIHSFWVPEFGQKMDAIPGHPNFVQFTPTKEGEYLGACSEYCGADHALMRIVVHVVSQEKFDEWTKSQLKVPTAAQDETTKKGEILFASATCVQCHAIAGTSAKALVGPDLTHVADRKTIGSGLMENNTENLARWIYNPQTFKPGAHMPKMNMTNDDAHAIAVYLESLK
ncbi:MAG TPA: cytochrome c oxidase subunit II [Planktothrix sp.]|jgi:cytochrome c oxidase subunit 2